MNIFRAQSAKRLLQPLLKVRYPARRSFVTQQRDLFPCFASTTPRLAFPNNTNSISPLVKSFAMSTQADHDARDKKAQKEIKEKCFVVGA
jgi:hypothetical protein